MDSIKKFCSKCGVEKELCYFYKDKTGKFGVRSNCKECHIKKIKSYPIQVDKKKEYMKEYVKKNIINIKEYRRLYYLKNKNKLLYNQKKYYHDKK